MKRHFNKATMRGGMAFLQRARNAVEGGFMHRPGWFEAMAQYQPPEMPKSQRSNVAALLYPEDRLLHVLARTHPELWTNTVVNLVPDALGHVHYTHPASAFVDRQKHWIAQGKTEEEAYEAVIEDWKRQKRFERIELQVTFFLYSKNTECVVRFFSFLFFFLPFFFFLGCHVAGRKHGS